MVICVLCLASGVLVAKLAGYDLGYAAGLYAGAQTISASMGLATDAINRLGLAADQTKAMLDRMPIAYAVTYIFGTVGSAIVIALVGPALLRIDLPAAAKDYEQKHGGTKEIGGAGSAWHRWELRAFRVRQGGKAVGLRAVEAEALVPNARVFVERIRRKDGTIEDATADSVIREGDVLAVVGPREVLVKVIGENAQEVDDAELLNVPVEGVDVYVTKKAVDGKTLAESRGCPRRAASSCAGSRGGRPPPRSPSCPAPRSSAATSSTSSAARRTPPPSPSGWASPIGRATSPTSRSSDSRSRSAR